MPPSRDALARIQRLRELFLDDQRGAAALPDYWRNRDDLDAYARLLAVRIGWKWDAALRECRERGMARSDGGLILDFGCGSGIGALRYLHWFGGRQLLCHDRSAVAMAYAVSAAKAAQPAVDASALPDLGDVTPDVLLVSHVLGELDDQGMAALQRAIDRSQRVVIVEPGNLRVARRLSALRDALLGPWHIVAPCPHALRCPTLATDGDWCHFFAPPPPEVFTDGEWVKTAREVGIDLRALPFSFLALERAPQPTPPPPNRVLGRPDLGKHEARVQTCTATGLQVHSVTKRHQPELWRKLKKGAEPVRWLPPQSGT